MLIPFTMPATLRTIDMSPVYDGTRTTFTIRMRVWAVLMLGLGLGTAHAQNQPQSMSLGQGASQTESNDMGDERPARWVQDLAAVRVLTAREQERTHFAGIHKISCGYPRNPTSSDALHVSAEELAAVAAAEALGVAAVVEQLSRTLFPLGEMRKPEVREEAKRTGLRLFEKPDSQEICFIPGGDYKKFLDAYLEEQGEVIPDTAGELLTTTGEVVGTHTGIHNFTVGQRKGLGVATGSPLYVLEIRGDKHQVVVGGGDGLLSRTLRAKALNWIAIGDLHQPMRVQAKIRHRHEAADAVLEKIGHDEVLATFDEPQRAIRSEEHTSE